MGSQLRHGNPRGGSLSLALLLVAWLLSSCVNKDGTNLPEAQMAFPIAIELSTEEQPKYAFVASSNFDLAYNVGSVQSYDLDVMVAAIDEVFADCQDRQIPPDRCAVYPSELNFELADEDRDDVVAVPIDGLLIDEVRIGSFADGMSVAEKGAQDGKGDRLYLPVRSDANLTFIDVVDGALRCGEPPSYGVEYGPDDQFRMCAASNRNADELAAPDLADPDADLSVPSDPVDVQAGNLMEDFPLPEGVTPTGDYSGQYVIMAHREGAASFFLDQYEDADAEEGEKGEKRPRLVATVDELAQEQVTVSYEPDARMAWIPSANTNEISRVLIQLGTNPAQTTLVAADPLVMSGLDTGFDAREVAFDPRPDSELAYVLSRSPENILVTRRDPVGDQLTFVPPQIAICSGPSRMQLASFASEGGGGEGLLAFVSCFDGRSVEIVDVDRATSFTRITNVSGAFEFQIDRSRERMYLADFSTSTLRIFDLAPMIACLPLETRDAEECAPVLLGIVGIPQAVSELPR